jgi:hypothetical protein
MPASSVIPATAFIARFAPAAAVLVIAACTSSSYISELQRLDSAPLCCEDSRQLPVSGALQTQLRVSLSDASPVFLFPSGRSRGFAFSLPDLPGPYEIEMAAQPMGVGGVHPATGGLAQKYVYPAVLFLDADRKAIVDDHDDELIVECPGFACKFTLTGRVPVPAEARYAVVHTLYERIGLYYSSTLQSRRGQPGGADKAFLYPGPPMMAFGLFGVNGDVLISVKRPVAEPAAEPDRR